jgi:hypothetical protein
MPQSQGTGNALIGSSFVDGELIFFNKATGATVFTISTTGTSSAGSTTLADDQILYFGDGSDLGMTWTTTGTDRFQVEPAAAETIWEFGVGTAASRMDVRFWGSNTTNNLYFDSSADLLYTNSIDIQLVDNDKVVFGTGVGAPGDFQIFFNATQLDIAPQTDDLLIRFGTPATPQLSPDVRFHGNAAAGADYMEIDASDSAVRMAGAMEMELSRMSWNTITAKTSDYVVTAAETGTIFHTTGALATVDFTLPTPAAGLSYRFFNAVDKGLKISGDAADKMIVFNDLDADDIRFYTGSQRIGAFVEVIGLSASKWFVVPHTARTQHTMTVTT